MEDAGFSEIKVLGEDVYSIELISGDPSIQAIYADLDLSSEKVNDLFSSVASIKVSAVKLH